MDKVVRIVIVLWHGLINLNFVYNYFLNVFIFINFVTRNVINV